MTPDLREAERVVRELTFSTFVFEIRLGHHLGYVRTFASPRVARLLARSGQIERDPVRRGGDTGLFLYELLHHGLDSPQGRDIVERVNAMHARWHFRDDDARWVLSTFVVPAVRIVERFGWRPLTDGEATALMTWYRELGVRLGVPDLPADLPAFRAETDAYEAEHLAPTEQGLRLLAATRDLLVEALPRPARPVLLAAAGELFEEPARSALGLHRPGPAVRRLTLAGLRLRAWRRRRRGPADTSWFVPGAPNTAYPDGYRLEDLGRASGTVPD